MRVAIITKGEVKKMLPVEIKNGILRHGKSILINSDLVPTGKMEWLKKQINAQNITPEIESYGIRIGDNGNGLVARWYDDILAEQQVAIKAAYNLLPVEIRAAREEREAISDLFDQAHRALNNDTDDNNVIRGLRLLSQAQTKFSDWENNYPLAAQKERGQELLSKADKQKSLAIGALTYDADGWLDSDARQKSHDEHMNKASELISQAKQLLTPEVAKW